MRVFMIAMGVLLTVTGVFCFANLEKEWSAFAFIVGVVMLIAGASNILSYLFEKKSRPHVGWVLAEGLLTVTLGVLALLYPFRADLVITAVFGMWLISSGVLRLTAVFEMKGSGLRKTPVALAGLCGIAVGVFGFVHLYVMSLALAAVVGVLFIMQGVNALVTGLALPSKRR
ncbi:MAG: DUF308 domain-containing protein [Clostridiales Family XIII bacterium]|jgi:uncharacterized membrane protein HdeD (DUF308 family)|nr:DUF308 domain-containing protein [Clostridiales Family XIII bacterium]